MAGIMTRRLTRELDKLHPGDEVDLRVYAGGQIEDDEGQDGRRRRSLRDVARASCRSGRRSRDARHQPRRDRKLARHLGVFVMSVDDGGPAAKAGIEEGSRIASINGVDVRGKRRATKRTICMRHVERQSPRARDRARQARRRRRSADLLQRPVSQREGQGRSARAICRAAIAR